jgi:hypothetical protein
MVYMLVRQKFNNYIQWRRAFDSLATERAAAGLRTLLVSRNIGDPNEAVVLLMARERQQVVTYLMSPALRDAGKWAGVVTGGTDVIFLEDTDSLLRACGH